MPPLHVQPHRLLEQLLSWTWPPRSASPLSAVLNLLSISLSQNICHIYMYIYIYVCVGDIKVCVFIPLKLFSIKWIWYILYDDIISNHLQIDSTNFPQQVTSSSSDPSVEPKIGAAPDLGVAASLGRVGWVGKPRFPAYGRWVFKPHVGAPNCAVGPSIKASLESANNPRGFIQVKCTKPRYTMPAKLSFRASSCSYGPWKKIQDMFHSPIVPLTSL